MKTSRVRNARLAALVLVLAAALTPALSQTGKREVPPQTKEGSFVGTWYYVDPAFHIAIFIEPDKTGLLTLRYKLSSKAGVNFETDAGGYVRYLDEGVAIEFLFTGTLSADQSKIEGRTERTAVAKNDRRVETGRFQLYRTSNGRSLVLQYLEYQTRATDSQGRTKVTNQDDMLMIFRKASDIVLDFSEIPF